MPAHTAGSDPHRAAEGAEPSLITSIDPEVLASWPDRPRPDALLLVLRNGFPLLLRPVEPADAALIRSAFERLSEKTRHLRFFRAITRLSDEDLDRLTRVDQFDHVAWGALDISGPEATGAGLGRFVRVEGEPCVAEFAIVVLDSLQSRGLGTVLLALLLVLAEPLGLRALRGAVLDDNESMLGWMRSLGAELVQENGVVSVFELPVMSAVPGFPGSSTAVHLEEVRADMRALLGQAWRDRARPAGSEAGR